MRCLKAETACNKRIFSLLQNMVQCLTANRKNGLEAHEKTNTKKTRFTFAIERMKDKKMLGTISLFNCNWVGRSAVWGIGIHSSANLG